MAEVTRVPIRPIARGSLAKLWLALALLVAAGAALAWWGAPRGVEVEVIEQGTGPTPGPSDVVFAKYVGKLPDGTVFDQSQELPLPVPGIFPEGNPLPLDAMVPGFREGLMKMRKGGKYRLTIPADLAYGDMPPPGAPIPPGADLTFEIELVDFMSQEDFQRRLEMLQQLMQQAQQGAGPGASRDEGRPDGARPQR